MNRHSVYLCGLLALAIGAGSLHAVDKGDRDQAMALLTGADAGIAKSDFTTAIEMCKRALNADATCPLAHFKLGECLEKSNKPRDAFKSYQQAAMLAKKENDTVTARKAQTAAEKLGKGLMDISAADQKLVDKLLPLADEALDDDQFGIARSAYASILSIQPAHEKAKVGLEKAEKAIEARGDPVKAKIAATMLAEVLYLNGIGEREKASKMAEDLSTRHGSTGPGKEAAELLANNFEPPKNLDVQLAEMKKEIQKISKPKAVGVKPVGSTQPAVTVAAPAVDVDAIEKQAMSDAKKLGKDQLITTYKDTYTKGKKAFSQAKPGSEGNQKNLQEALRNFISCEQLYIRIDEEKLGTAEIERMQKEASSCRYSCMKMTILGH